MASCEIERVHHHARGAEAALQAVVLLERRLHRVQRAVGLRHALDGHDVGALGLHGDDRAALDGLAVHEHGAGAALRGVAADVRAGEPQVLADEGDEQRARLDFGRGRLAVDLHGYLDGHARALLWDSQWNRGVEALGEINATAAVSFAPAMRLLIVEDDVAARHRPQPHPRGRGTRGRRHFPRRGGGRCCIAGALRPGDPRHRPAADGRLRGAAAPARRTIRQRRPGAGARADGARRGRRPRARPRPGRRRLHGQALRHA